MALIYETKYFTLESHEKPEIDRLEGGHIKINPKRIIVDRTFLTKDEAIDLMRLTIIAGKAFISGMKQRGVTIGRINYQDNGNWKPELHIHLYGRAIDATIQKYGDPLTPGHKDGFNPLDREDIALITQECEKLYQTEEFSNNLWGL